MATLEKSSTAVENQEEGKETVTLTVLKRLILDKWVWLQNQVVLPHAYYCLFTLISATITEKNAITMSSGLKYYSLVNG